MIKTLVRNQFNIFLITLLLVVVALLSVWQYFILQDHSYTQFDLNGLERIQNKIIEIEKNRNLGTNRSSLDNVRNTSESGVKINIIAQNPIEDFANTIDSKKKEIKQNIKSNSVSIPSIQTEGKLIDINLSTQKLTAYYDGEVINQFTVSTGKRGHETPTGNYSITDKIAVKTYSGDDYYLPNTKWNMRYDGPYLIHTAWWHNNFGTPISHGCTNMREADAEWLYHWASVGTSIYIHY